MENVDSTMYLHPPSCMGGKSHHSFCRPAGSHNLKRQNNMKKSKMGCVNLLIIKPKYPSATRLSTNEALHPSTILIILIHTSISVSNYPSIPLFIYSSIHHSCVYLFNIHPSINVSIQPQLHPFLYPTIYPSFH